MRRHIDPDTAAGIKRALRQALDTEARQSATEHEEMVKRILGHMDTFIEEGEGGPGD